MNGYESPEYYFLGMSPKQFLIFFLILLITYTVLLVNIAQMAKDRGYSPTPWVWFGLFFPPVIVMCILACFIQTPAMYAKRQQMLQAALDEISSLPEKPSINVTIPEVALEDSNAGIVEDTPKPLNKNAFNRLIDKWLDSYMTDNQSKD